MSGYIFMEQVIQLLYNAHYAFDNGEFFLADWTVLHFIFSSTLINNDLVESVSF